MLSLVGNEDPVRLRIHLDGLFEMSDEVGFRAGGSTTGSHDLAGGYIQMGDQTMACHAVHMQMLLARRDQAAWARTRGDAGSAWMPVISSVLATCVPDAVSAGVASYTSHTVWICGQFGRIVGKWGEEVTLAMRLQSARLLLRSLLPHQRSPAEHRLPGPLLEDVRREAVLTALAANTARCPVFPHSCIQGILAASSGALFSEWPGKTAGDLSLSEILILGPIW